MIDGGVDIGGNIVHEAIEHGQTGAEDHDDGYCFGFGGVDVEGFGEGSCHVADEGADFGRFEGALSEFGEEGCEGVILGGVDIGGE